MRLPRYILFNMTLTLACAPALAAPPEPLEMLQAKGLQRSGNWLLLPEEVQLAQDLHEGYVKKSKMIQAQEQARRAEAAGQSSKLELARLIGQMAQLQRKLPLARGPRERTAAAADINALVSRIATLQATDPEKKARQTWAAVTSTIGDYTQTVVKLRQQYDDLLPRYAALQRDPQVKSAIEQLNADGQAQYALGPGSGQRKRLENLESLVMADTVPLRRGADGLWHVSVLVNGKASQDMAIDSGASIVLLPMRAAQAAGITPGPTAPTLRMVVASGGQVDARMVVADSLRVGRFVAENVECAVLPENFKDVPALLGQSFLQRFRQTIDASRSRWELASVQDPTKQDATKADAKSPPLPQPPEPALSSRAETAAAEPLPRLLEITGDDPRAAKTVDVQLDGGAVTFHSSRLYEAAGLRQLVGPPRQVHKLNLPGHNDWELWTWEKVQVLVDPQGMTRYYAVKPGG